MTLDAQLDDWEKHVPVAVANSSSTATSGSVQSFLLPSDHWIPSP